MSAADPFTFLVDAIWDALNANDSFTSLVKEANRIKLDDKFNPFKSTLSEASVPEVIILPVGKAWYYENDTSGMCVAQRLHITVATGLRNTSLLFPVEWQIIKAIYTVLERDTDNIMDLEWNGEKIIKSMSWPDIEEGLSYEELNKNLVGWATIIPLEAKLRFSRTLLEIVS